MGTLSAESPRQARDQLRAQGLTIRTLSEIGARTGGWSWVPSWSWQRPQQTVSAIRDLSTLLAVGVPLVEALDVLLSQLKGSARTGWLELRERVSAGAGLAESMAAQPRLFDAITVQMVSVGENAGTLDTVLGQLSDFKERAFQLRDRVTTALLYPGLVLLCAVGVTLFLMNVVVPTLLDNLLESGRPLPWPTKILRFVTDLLTGYGFVVGVITIMATALILAWGATRNGRRTWQRGLLHVPLIGDMVRKQTVSRVALMISVLLKSGVEFLKAIEIAAASMSHMILQEALRDCADAVRQGRDLGPALAQSGLFPPVVVQVFAVGQQTGQLEQMLERLALDYDRQVDVLSQRFAALLEPLLIIVLSSIVGFILFATVLPILEAGHVM